MAAIRIGIGGWNFEPWRGVFYPPRHPQKRELEYASRQLTSIEINSTYYGSQKPASFAKWREETPEGFVFALKGPRYATNRRVLAEAGSSIERFVTGGLLELKDRLGPINWQFMATKAFDPEDFEAFLKLLPDSVEGVALRHAVEVRHPSFRDPAFAELLRRYKVACVVAGDSEFPQIADLTADFVYARVMGTREEEPEGYGASELDRWAACARTWSQGGAPEGLDYAGARKDSEVKKGGREVFFYVISGHKTHNPAAARALIARSG